MPTFDPISGAPISSLGAYLSQEVTQSIGLSDSLGLVIDRNIVVDQTITLTDSIGLNTILFQDVSSTLSVSDSINLALEYLRVVADTYSLSDSHTVLFIDNTEPYETLSLSQVVALNVIRLVSFEDNIEWFDSALRVLSYSVEDTLSLSDVLEKITPEVTIANTLALSQVVEPTLTLSIALAQSFTLTQLLYRELPKSFIQTLTFTGTVEARNLPYFDYTDTLNLVQGIEYLTNLDAVNSASLQLSHIVSLTVFPVQSLIQTLALVDAVDIYNFAQQNMVSDLTMIGEAAYTLFEQQVMLSLLTLSHLIEPRNLAKQDDPSTLTLTHSVSVIVSSTGPKSASSTFTLRQEVGLNQVKFFEICQCLNLTNSVHKAIELEVSHDLDLSQDYIPGQPVSELTLSHEVGINVTFDACCGAVFVQDKVTSNKLELSHAVTLGHGSVLNLASSLTLSQTAAYYIL